MYKIQNMIRVALVLALAFTSMAAFAADGGVVNVNTAEHDQLTLLPRVGPALAQRILDYREANGTFEESSDLLLVRGIGEKTFALMEPFVVVKGDSTLSRKIRVSDLEKAAAAQTEQGSKGSPSES